MNFALKIHPLKTGGGENANTYAEEIGVRLHLCLTERRKVQKTSCVQVSMFECLNEREVNRVFA